MIKRILCCLKVIVGNSIEYKKGRSIDLTSCCDADWAGDLNDGKSSSGYVFDIIM